MKIYLSLLLIPLLALPALVGAQGVDVRTNTNADVRTRTTEIRLENRAEFEARRAEHQETREETRVEFQARVEDRKEVMLQNRAEIKARLEAEAKTRIASIIDRISAHFDRIILRFEQASDRLETRIASLEDRGVDVSVSVELFAQAEAQLEVTKDVIVQVEADIETELEQEEVSRDNIMALVEIAKTSVRETQDAYVSVIRSLRADVNTEAEANINTQENDSVE